MRRSTLFLATVLLAALSGRAVPQEAATFPAFSRGEASAVAVALQQYATTMLPEKILPQVPEADKRLDALNAVTYVLDAVGPEGINLTRVMILANGPPSLTEEQAAHVWLAVDLTVQIKIAALASRDIRANLQDHFEGLGHDWDDVYEVGLDQLCDLIAARRRIGKSGRHLVTAR